MKKTYLSAAETAKLVRAALKRAFPGIKFSVRSDTYSGGASIRVRWTDGPTRKAVEAVAGAYQGGGFDSSIDLKYHVDHWLLPDGSVSVAQYEGIQGCLGYIPTDWRAMADADAKLVSFGADFIFCERDISPELQARIDGYAARHLPRDMDDWSFSREIHRIAANAMLHGGNLYITKGA